MNGPSLTWNTAFHANLVLWSEPTLNIRVLALQDGTAYNERKFLDAIHAEAVAKTSRGKGWRSSKGSLPAEEDQATGKVPKETRTVRNTFEAMTRAGLAYRKDGVDTFSLTGLGRCVLSFLGIGQERRFANPGNRQLLGEVLIRGLSIVTEYRAVWRLMRAVGDYLTNEELNRALRIAASVEGVDLAAQRILKAREQGDPKQIGPRLYRDDLFDTDPSEQRKAMNPQFLLAGGGGVFINVTGTEERRWLEPWAIPLVDHALSVAVPEFHASTAAADALQISASAVVPPRMI